MIKGTLDFDYMDHLSFPLLPHILDTKFKDSLATLEVKITDKSGKIRTITKTPFEKRLQDISTPDFNPLRPVGLTTSLDNLSTLGQIVFLQWMTTFSAPYGIFLLASASWQQC